MVTETPVLNMSMLICCENSPFDSFQSFSSLTYGVRTYTSDHWAPLQSMDGYWVAQRLLKDFVNSVSKVHLYS